MNKSLCFSFCGYTVVVRIEMPTRQAIPLKNDWLATLITLLSLTTQVRVYGH
jgi:hypothetical protein